MNDPLAQQLTLEVASFLIDRQSRHLSPRSIQFYRAELYKALAFWNENNVPYHRTTGCSGHPRLCHPHGRDAQYRQRTCRLPGDQGVPELVGCRDRAGRMEEPHREGPRQPAECRATAGDLLGTSAPRTSWDNGTGNFMLPAGQRRPAGRAGVSEHRRRQPGYGRRDREEGQGRQVSDHLHWSQNKAGSDPLWVTGMGQRLRSEGLRDVVKRHAERCGFEEPGLHEFRRTFAVTCLPTVWISLHSRG